MAQSSSAQPTYSEKNGDDARSPQELSWPGWKAIAVRLYHEITNDRVLMIAGGVTFYLLLAMFRALAAFVSVYGLMAGPATVSDYVEQTRGGDREARGGDSGRQRQARARRRTRARGYGSPV